MLATRYPDGIAEGVFPLTGNADAIANFSGDGPQGLGTFFVATAGVDAITLAAPLAGNPYATGGQQPTGDDGRIIMILSLGAYAHTVTTPANGINGAYHIATFAAAVANYVTFIAYNGVWYMIEQLGITLS